LTSAGAGEGKTLTALNLTQVFGRSGVKTLLVDCDLRRPMVHKALGMKSEPGLTNILINKVEPEEAVRRLENHQAFVLPCGTLPPNPSEILDSQKMRDLLERLKKEYDLIILDSPPLIAITDSLVLSKEVDGVCLVIKSGRTHRDMAMKAKRLLESARARIIGAILNDVNLKKVYGYYQDYYSYYTKHQKHPKRSGMVEKISDHKKSMV
jgi:capsular exopolysaccharide synthesis family protein